MSEPLGKNPIDLFEERVILFQPAFHVSGMGMSLVFVFTQLSSLYDHYDYLDYLEQVCRADHSAGVASADRHKF